MHLLKDMKSEGKSTTVTEEEEPTEDEIKKQVDIDPKLEEELCELWDMTMDTVSGFVGSAGRTQCSLWVAYNWWLP